MASKLYAHDLDLAKVAQLVNARKQNVTNAQMDALAGTLTAANVGLFVWNTTQGKDFTWNGTAFADDRVEIAGAMVYQGAWPSLTFTPGTQSDGATSTADGLKRGDYYVYSGADVISGTDNVGAGVLAPAGMSNVVFFPNANIEKGDAIVYRGQELISTVLTDVFDVYQRNNVQASETTMGNVRLATNAEAISGTGTQEAITPASLKATLITEKYPRQFFGTFDLAADVPTVITHNLNLADRDAFTFNAMLGNSQFSVDVDSTNVNSLTVTSLVAIIGAKITILGSSLG